MNETTSVITREVIHRVDGSDAFRHREEWNGYAIEYQAPTKEALLELIEDVQRRNKINRENEKIAKSVNTVV
jgi:hypothetical protein